MQQVLDAKYELSMILICEFGQITPLIFLWKDHDILVGKWEKPLTNPKEEDPSLRATVVRFVRAFS